MNDSYHAYLNIQINRFQKFFETLMDNMLWTAWSTLCTKKWHAQWILTTYVCYKSCTRNAYKTMPRLFPVIHIVLLKIYNIYQCKLVTNGAAESVLFTQKNLHNKQKTELLMHAAQESINDAYLRVIYRFKFHLQSYCYMSKVVVACIKIRQHTAWAWGWKIWTLGPRKDLF